MVEPKMTRRRLSARREGQLAGYIKKAVMDGEIPKARQMIGQLVRDSIKRNTCLSLTCLKPVANMRKSRAITREMHLITREIHLITREIRPRTITSNYPRNSGAHTRNLPSRTLYATKQISFIRMNKAKLSFKLF